MSSITEIYRRFPTAEAAVAHLEQIRWPSGPRCPYCGADTAARHNEIGRAARWQCWTCSKSFSATVDTIFNNSHIDLQRWFLLISLMLNAKKGLSAMQAARDLEMRRPTVWSMMHRVRRALVDDGKLLAGLVEMDESFVGGKPRKRNRRDDDIDAPRGRGTKKAAVVGAVERGGRVKAEDIAVTEALLGRPLEGLPARDNPAELGAEIGAFCHLEIRQAAPHNGDDKGAHNNDCGIRIVSGVRTVRHGM